MADFFHMGGYGAYIWSSFGIAALALAALAVESRRNFRRLTAEANRLKADSPRHREDKDQ